MREVTKCHVGRCGPVSVDTLAHANVMIGMVGDGQHSSGVLLVYPQTSPPKERPDATISHPYRSRYLR